MLALSVCQVKAQNYNALSWSMNTAYNNYLLRVVHNQYEQRRQALSIALSSRGKFIDYQKNCRERYLSIFGDVPASCALNAKIVGTLREDSFSIQKIIYQSCPGRYVTGNLYLPIGNGKYPVAVEMCGHGLNGKIPASYMAILLARNGIAVFVVDPFGQGERKQLLDSSGNPVTRGATTEHTLLNAGCNLVGTSLAAQECWDNHRAIDYLLTRTDIDPSKIAAYGSSGGGTQTAYLLAFDKRIKAAAIDSYFSQRERVLELQGPSDGCQHIPYEGKEQIEIPDFVLMAAPTPTLILSGYYDFVDLWGAQHGYKELEQAYTLLGAKDKVDMLTVQSGHGLNREKMMKLATWFKLWLCNDKSPICLPHYYSIPDESLLCTNTGEVNTSISSSNSIMKEFSGLIDKYGTDRLKFLSESYSKQKEQVLRLLGLEVNKNSIIPEVTGKVIDRNYILYKYQIIRKGEMSVPCVALYPNRILRSSSVVVILKEMGKDACINEGIIDKYINQGDIVVVADLPGCGETKDPEMYNDAKYWNDEYRTEMISMHIGRPIMGQRVMDMITLLDFITRQKEMNNHPVSIIADGLYGSVAIHAAFLDSRIKNIEISNSMKSFKDYVINPLQRDMYKNVLYGVLKYYDLPDLIKLCKAEIHYSD